MPCLWIIFLRENTQCQVISGYKCRPDGIHGVEKENELEKETKDIQGEKKKTWGSRVS